MNLYLVTVLRYCGDHSTPIDKVVTSNVPLSRDQIVEKIELSLHDEIQNIQILEVIENV